MSVCVCTNICFLFHSKLSRCIWALHAFWPLFLSSLAGSFPNSLSGYFKPLPCSSSPSLIPSHSGTVISLTASLKRWGPVGGHPCSFPPLHPKDSPPFLPSFSDLSPLLRTNQCRAAQGVVKHFVWKIPRTHFLCKLSLELSNMIFQTLSILF